ncbi:hypothetical protein [Marinagarivorans algicola]|uniref:hypothetical protein n=1 Tax=Marinagarivorans algicola TaxID=1513270 RepID=UPI0009EB8738|nr:hypothetical protein [Marinagarivorans algicola]
MADLKPITVPAAAEGFEYIRRFWDESAQVVTAKILPGQCYVTQQQEVMTTVLGSCVTACIRDPEAQVGGMNHFMLPLQYGSVGISRADTIGSALCYGNWAMEYLLKSILKLGGRKERLEIKLFGGGRVLTGITYIDIGQQNIQFVLEYLMEEGLKVVAQDMGGIYPRKILYCPLSGHVKMKKLKVVGARELVK